MERLNAKMVNVTKRPVKVMQFGEGNFLRAFVDYMLDIANEKTDFNGSVVLVKPITFGSLETDTLYKLSEETPPNGYAIITKDIFFALRPSGNTVSLRFYDAAGHEIAAPSGVAGEYITGSHLLTLTVKNLRGYELPSTGSSAMFIHILCGLPLILAPLVYGIGLRRKHERRSRK